MKVEPFIVFEGLNGAGKSSLCGALASYLNGILISTPHRSIGCFREAMDGVSLQARFFYYMLGNVLVSDEVRTIRQTQTVVCDRYVDSTLARHAVLGLDVGRFDLKPFNLEQPDISFFIYCDEDERRNRIELRGKKTKWDLLDENEELRIQYVEYFRRTSKYVFIDTSHESMEESLEKIQAELVKSNI